MNYVFYAVLLGQIFISHCLATCWSYENPDYTPRIELEYKIILSTEMRKALKEYDSQFKILKPDDFSLLLRSMYDFTTKSQRWPCLEYQTPSAVIGDFNGDKISDIVLMGYNETHIKTIVILSEKSKYRVIEIRATPVESKFGNNKEKLESYLELVSPGKIKAVYDRPELDLKNDAFITGVCEKASSIWIYKDGKFINYIMSD